MGYFSRVLEIFALVALLNIDSISSREDYTLYELTKDHLEYRIGLGTAGLGHVTSSIVGKALNYNVKVIDTAQAEEWYNETAVGEALSTWTKASGNNVDDVVVVNKIHPRSFRYDKMEEKIKESISNLGKSALDVVLLHSPRCWDGHCTEEELSISWRVGWKNLEKLQVKYGIREIGVSNFDYQELEELVLELSNAKVSVIQNWMDPFRQDVHVRMFAREHQIEYMAYSSFGTQWFGYGFDHNVVFYNPVLDKIALKHDSTIAKVVLAWLLKEGVIALPRSSKEEHLQENFSFLLDEKTRIVLDEDDMGLIRSLDGILIVD